MSEELEVQSIPKSDDFWNTYQEFFFNSVGVSEMLVNLSSEGLSSYHYVVSDTVQLTLEIIPADSSHVLYNEDPFSHSVYADGSYHTQVCDNVGVTVHLNVDGAEHYHYADDFGLALDGLLSVYDSAHNTLAEIAASFLAVTAPDIVPANTKHVLEDNGFQRTSLIFKTPVYADDTSHYSYCAGNLYIGNGNEVYARDCAHGITAEEVGAFTFKSILYFVTKGTHLHIVDHIASLPLSLSLSAVSSTEHAVSSERVSPTFVLANPCSHGVKSKVVWSWMNDAYHKVLSPEIALQVSLDVLSCSHSFSPTSYPYLVASLSVNDCYHSLFTKDIISPDGCEHELVSPELISNALYRRLNV